MRCTLWLLPLLLGCPPVLDNGDPGDDDATADDDDIVGPCGVEDLELLAVVRGPNGDTGPYFMPGEALEAGGILWNPCPVAQSFETRSGCLLDTWEVYDAAGQALDGRGCDDAITWWTLESGGSLEDMVPIGAPPLGDYALNVGFGGGQWAEASFSILAPPG